MNGGAWQASVHGVANDLATKQQQSSCEAGQNKSCAPSFTQEKTGIPIH